MYVSVIFSKYLEKGKYAIEIVPKLTEDGLALYGTRLDPVFDAKETIQETLADSIKQVEIEMRKMYQKYMDVADDFRQELYSGMVTVVEEKECEE